MTTEKRDLLAEIMRIRRLQVPPIWRIAKATKGGVEGVVITPDIHSAVVTGDKPTRKMYVDDAHIRMDRVRSKLLYLVPHIQIDVGEVSMFVRAVEPPPSKPKQKSSDINWGAFTTSSGVRYYPTYDPCPYDTQ